jgi:ubiquinone/menaquinone biosynthesis C-methylase UbiE
VERQYRDASNLNARVALQARFSTNSYGWQRWVFDKLELPPEAQVLELGCGPGLLWRGNLDRVPEGWSVALTDASPGMLAEAESHLGEDSRFTFRVVDAREIPFEDGSFDAVVANNMLYHVPDLPRALSEVARVLGPGGTMYATTVGRDHLLEMSPFLAVLDPSHPPDEPIWYYLPFNLENGAEQLSLLFSEVSLLPYEDALVISEAKPLVDYLLSTPSAQAAADRSAEAAFRERVSALRTTLERELASRGGIRISKHTGMFVART